MYITVRGHCVRPNLNFELICVCFIHIDSDQNSKGTVVLQELAKNLFTKIATSEAGPSFTKVSYYYYLKKSLPIQIYVINTHSHCHQIFSKVDKSPLILSHSP